MEYEVIRHDQIQGLKLLVDDITYRTPHMHREFELGVVISGALRISSFHEQIEIPSGELFLINPWQTHEFHAADGPATVFFMQVLPDVLKGYFPSAPRLRFLQSSLSQALSSWVMRELHKTMIELGKTYFAMEPVYEFVCMQKLNRVFELLMKYADWEILTSEENKHEAIVQQRLERIMQFVRDNYRQKILLKQVAEREHLSESFMTHFVQKHLNMSFQDYVALTRFEHAQTLLEHSTLSIAEICNECGFSDRRYLNKVCLAQTGMLPKEYRRKRGTVQADRQIATDATVERLYSDEEALQCLKTLQEL